MNFLKKKLKPLTSGLTSAASNQKGGQHSKQNRDLEDDLYDEYVVEAPPHPSELLALGVDPNEIDANDPEKLRELYRKAKEQGKDKQANSTLLARQRQKEEIEQRKKTAEEWKYFDSITARVEQVVKESQKNLSQWKESSAIDKLTEPEYELRLTPDQVFKSSVGHQKEQGEENWIDFDDDSSALASKKKKNNNKNKDKVIDLDEFNDDNNNDSVDEFGCPKDPQKRASIVSQTSIGVKQKSFVVNELLEDFGLDLRSSKEKQSAEEEEKRRKLVELREAKQREAERQAAEAKNIDFKVAARPRPRPKSQQQVAKDQQQQATSTSEPDPFDTSFVAQTIVGEETKQENFKEEIASFQEKATIDKAATEASNTYVDPFDTSYINL